MGAGRTYFSIAARETRDGCVFRYGADAVRVSSARGATPATVALLQGMDVAERLVAARPAVPPSRRAREVATARAARPRSTLSPIRVRGFGGWSEDREEEDREEDRVTGDGKRETARSRNGASFDDDRSSVVSSKHGYEEKSPAWDDRGLFPAFIEELIEAFRHVDTDRGGDIDENELKFAARALGFEPHPKRLRAMLAAMDTDGGGSVDSASSSKRSRDASPSRRSRTRSTPPSTRSTLSGRVASLYRTSPRSRGASATPSPRKN